MILLILLVDTQEMLATVLKDFKRVITKANGPY